jgi:hypothetical protein
MSGAPPAMGLVLLIMVYVGSGTRHGIGLWGIEEYEPDKNNSQKDTSGEQEIAPTKKINLTINNALP